QTKTKQQPYTTLFRSKVQEDKKQEDVNHSNIREAKPDENSPAVVGSEGGKGSEERPKNPPHYREKKESFSRPLSYYDQFQTGGRDRKSTRLNSSHEWI